MLILFEICRNQTYRSMCLFSNDNITKNVSLVFSPFHIPQKTVMLKGIQVIFLLQSGSLVTVTEVVVVEVAVEEVEHLILIELADSEQLGWTSLR